MPSAKSLTSAEGLGAIYTARRIRICPIYHIMILSGMFMVMLGSAPAENRSLQPLPGQKSIRLRSRTKGVICLCRLQQWVINWQGSKHCTRMPIKSLYQSLEPQPQESILLILWFQKKFLNMESSSIKHTFNEFIKVILTHLASSTQERGKEWPRTTQWEITEASSISFLANSHASANGRTQVKSLSGKWWN